MYGFRHVLFQEAAYESLLRKERVSHHHTAAEAIVLRFPEVCETRPELVAYHFTNAGIVDKAIDYWQLAGDRAVSRFANAEAIAHLSKAVELVGRLEQSAEQLHRELVLQTTLGAAHSIHDGWQAPGTARAYERAFEICKKIPDAPEQFWVLWQLGAHYQSQEIAKGHAIAQQLVRMAEAAGDPTLLVEGRFGLSAGLFLSGRLGDAYANLQATEELYDKSVDRSTISPTGQNIAVNNLLYLGIVETLLGRPSEGLKCSQRAIDLARECAGPPHQAAALCWQGFQLAILGQAEQTLINAETALPLSTDFFLGRLWANVLRGWALARRGACDEAILIMRETIDTYRSTGMRLLLSWLLTLQADGLLACGEPERCIRTANEGFDASTESGEAFARAELYRIIGDAQRSLGRHDDARDSLESALATAQGQGAATLVLKSTLSYARLLSDRGEDALARERLDRACQAFDDNAEFSDLEEARVLRNALG